MTNNPLVSVLVPVYNTEQYLCDCLNSLISQTYSNIEIILIDDGSTDSSPSICDTFALQDKRIVVIHKKNTGVSDTRNVGLEIARGDYIVFVDSDDFIDKSCIEILVKNHDGKSTTMVGTNYQRFFKESEIQINTDNEKIEVDSIQFIKTRKGFYSWSILYSKSLINKALLQFDINLEALEDAAFLGEYFLFAEKIVFIDIPLYFYRINDSSLTSKFDNHSYYANCWDRVFYSYLNYFHKVNIKSTKRALMKKLLLRSKVRFYDECTFGKISIVDSYLMKKENKKSAKQTNLSFFIHQSFTESIIFYILFKIRKIIK